jgi:hypothetical protein
MYVCTFVRTAVEDVALVEGLEPLEDLDEVHPDHALVDVLPPLHVAVFLLGGGDVGVGGGGLRVFCKAVGMVSPRPSVWSIELITIIAMVMMTRNHAPLDLHGEVPPPAVLHHDAEVVPVFALHMCVSMVKV